MKEENFANQKIYMYNYYTELQVQYNGENVL